MKRSTIPIILTLLTLKVVAQQQVWKIDTGYIWMNTEFMDSSLTSRLIQEADSFSNNYFVYRCTTYVGLLDNQSRTGEWTYRNCDDGKSGNLIATINYSNDTFNGKYISHYNDSTIKSIFNFNNGILTGPFECYMENGAILYSGEIDSNQDHINGWINYSRGAYKKPKEFLIEDLRNEWINQIE